MRIPFLIAGMLISGGLLTTNALAATLPQLSELQSRLEQQDYAELARELQPFEYQFAGQPDYDYIYGLALLRSGKPQEASWALERLILMRPYSADARLAMAETWLQMNRPDDAQQELTQVLASASGEEKVRLQEQSASLQARVMRERAPRRLAVDTRLVLGLGYDSNVSAAPGFRYDPADPAGEETPSLFSELRFRQRLAYTLNEQWKLNAGYSLQDSRPYSESDYIRQNLGLQAGVGYTARNWQIDVTPGFTKSWMDGEGEFAEVRLDLGGNYDLGGGQHLLGFINRSSLSYDVTEAADGDFTLLGGGWSGQPASQPWPVHWMITGYTLFSDQPDNPAGDLVLFGINLLASLNTERFGSLRARLGINHRDYDCSGHPAVCDADRTDRQLTVGLGSIHQLADHWHLEPQLSYVIQASNDDDYEYNRLIAKVSVRYDFDTWKR